MAFRLKIRRHVYQQLNSCGRPDAVLADAFIRLREQLAEYPQRYLQRIQEPFDGMAYGFNMVDPGNRFCEHHFIFHVLFGADEESVVVARGLSARPRSMILSTQSNGRPQGPPVVTSGVSSTSGPGKRKALGRAAGLPFK